MIALYEGTSVKSRMIEWWSWSQFSHASWVKRNGRVVEAWRGGVSEWPTIHHNHTPGTRVIFLDLDLTPEQVERIESFLTSQLGKGYDFLGVNRFLTRSQTPDDPERWFCSELIFAAFLHAGIELLARVEARKVMPVMLFYSPLLREKGGIVTKEAGAISEG